MKNKKWILLFACFSLLVACNQTKGGSNSSSSISSGGISDSSSSSSSSIPDNPSTGGSSGSSGGSDSSSSGQVVDPSQPIETVVAQAAEKKDLLLKGTIDYEEVSSYSTNEYTISFEYGVDDFFYFTEPNFSGTLIEFYLVYDNNNVIVPIQYDPSTQTVSKNWDTYEALGYRFDSVLDWQTVYFGVEDLISGTYELGAANTNQDFTESYTDGVYTYSFGYIPSPDSYNYYEVDVEFTIGSQGEFNWATIVSNVYSSTSFIYDTEYNVVQLQPNATPSNTYTYEINQETGTRTKVNPYPYDDFLATSFDLVYNGTAITDNQVIDMEVGWANAISLSVSNVLPTTASFSFDAITATVLDEDEIATTNVTVSFNSFSNTVEVNASVAGNYTVTLTSAKVTKTFSLNVSQAQPQSVYVTYYYRSVNDYTADTLPISMTAYVNTELYFQPSVNPMEAVQDVTISVDGDASAYSMQETTIQNSIGAVIEVTQITFTATGTYVVTFASTMNADVFTSTTINVVERPQMSEVLTGEFGHKTTGTNFDYYITFTPIGDGMTGTAVLENRTTNSVENANYTVVVRDDGCYEVSFEHVDGATLNFEVVLGPSYNMILYIPNGDYVSSSYTMDKVTPALVIAATWETMLDDGTTISFVFQRNGIVNITAYNWNIDYYENFECYFTVTETENGYSITFTPNSYTPETNTIISFDETATVAEDYSSITITVYCSGSGQSVTLTATSW